MATADDKTMTVEDLKARYEGDLSTRYRDDYLQIKLDEAIALIGSECPTAAARLAAGTLSPTNYKRIIADAVFRVIRNPGGYSTESEGGASYGLRATVASGDLWLTDRDKATLTGRTDADAKGLPGSVSLGIDAGWSR